MNKTSRIMMIIVIICLIGVNILGKTKEGNQKYIVSEQENKEDDIDIYVSEGSDINNEESLNGTGNEEIKIFISGEVNSPNVVSVRKEDRLLDAIDKVDGLTNEADINNINLAMKLEDGEHYVIPKIGESEVSLPSYNNSSENKKDSKVNINTADEGELDSLPGVGPSTAQKIINHRNEIGKFKSIEDLKNVNGIGDKKYDDIKELVSI